MTTGESSSSWPRAVEAAAKAMYHFVEGPAAPWYPASAHAGYYREEAAAALRAARPYLTGDGDPGVSTDGRLESEVAES